jgi:hypothetical protein
VTDTDAIHDHENDGAFRAGIRCLFQCLHEMFLAFSERFSRIV